MYADQCPRTCWYHIPFGSHYEETMRRYVLVVTVLPLLASACVGGHTPDSIPEPTQSPITGAASIPTREPTATAEPASSTSSTLLNVLVDSGRRLEGDRTFSIALGDLDRDGDLDVLVASYLSPGNVWWNNGSGDLERGQTVGTETGHGVALGDLDGDGDLDAFVIHNGNVDQVWLNDGTGYLTDSGQRLGLPEDATTMVTLGDVDGDGDLDALTTQYQRPVKIWLNDGGGVFTARKAGPGSDALSVVLGDMDGDGDLDALVSFVEKPDRIWLNDGRGTFAETEQELGGESGWGRAALGDVDSDGDLDAFVSNSVDGDIIWFNTGGAEGGVPGVLASSSQILGIGSHATLGDVDGDKDLDTLTCQGLWLNDGDGTFRDTGTRFDVPGCGGVWLGDVDGDGDLDALFASHKQDNELWLNKSR